MTKAEIPSQATEQSETVQPTILVRVVDARKPFPVLATYRLAVVPRPGDLINIQVSTGLAGYRVDFVNCDPFAAAQVVLGCLPSDIGAISAAEAKSKVDEIVKRQIQIFERAQAYTNALTVAGYAGSFGIWTFVRPDLTARGTNTIALMLGTSLLIFITWEIYSMIARARAQTKFFQATTDPQSFLEREARIAEEERKSAASYFASGKW